MHSQIIARLQCYGFFVTPFDKLQLHYFISFYKIFRDKVTGTGLEPTTT